MTSDNQPLSVTPKGQSVCIEAFSDEFVELKMLEMGVVPGEMAVVEFLAPSGDPMAIRVADSVIGVRKEEASKILVKINP
ncbi:MAG: FeoA family protein [Bacteroidia bacterium]